MLVNAIAPGPFQTDMLEDFEKSSHGFIEMFADVTLQKRVARLG